jgi:hypothetical protein
MNSTGSGSLVYIYIWLATLWYYTCAELIGLTWGWYQHWGLCLVNLISKLSVLIGCHWHCNWRLWLAICHWCVYLTGLMLHWIQLLLKYIFKQYNARPELCTDKPCYTIVYKINTIYTYGFQLEFKCTVYVSTRNAIWPVISKITVRDLI